MKQQNLLRVALITAGLLLIPLVAMQVTEEVEWTSSDFIVMGTLIFATGLAFTAAMSHFKERKQRLLAGAAIGIAFLYVWAELAVGVFTNIGS